MVFPNINQFVPEKLRRPFRADSGFGLGPNMALSRNSFVAYTDEHASAKCHRASGAIGVLFEGKLSASCVMGMVSNSDQLHQHQGNLYNVFSMALPEQHRVDEGSRRNYVCSSRHLPFSAFGVRHTRFPPVITACHLLGRWFLPDNHQSNAMI